MSLRRRLTLTLWLALLVVGGISAGIAYWQALSNANELLDYQLQQVAGFIAAEKTPNLQLVSHPVSVDVDHDEEDDIVVSITSEDGRAVMASNRDWLGVTQKQPGFANYQNHGTEYRVFALPSSGRQILVAQQLATRREVAGSAAMSSLAPILVLLPVLGVAIWLVTRRTLSPLHALSRELPSRPVLSLEPLRVSGLPSEVRPFVEEMNRLLTRLSEAISHEKRFIADAAHGLRTPLAALQLQADVVDGSPDPTERQARLADLRKGITRTARLAEHLLVLSRAGHRNVGHTSCDIQTVLRDLADQYRPIAEHLQVSIQLVQASRQQVMGDARLLMVMLGNLLDNALRYTPAKGVVEVVSRTDGSSVVVDIADEGPGLPETELERVFERFYRAPDDPSEGSGLGLAAVRSIVNDLGGAATLKNRSDRAGLIARVILPSAPSGG